MSSDSGRLTAADLFSDPNAISGDYYRFRVRERLLLSGHSHQAWPDCAFAGQLRAFTDAAERVDDKWELAFEQARQVRVGYQRLLDDPDGCYSLAASTHDLLVRFLSSLPLRQRPKLVSTDAEFHSLRRQLDRLEEEGLEILRVAAHPAETVGSRLAQAVCDRTAAVLTSTVFFTSARIAGELGRAAEACRKHGAALLLDLYHQLNVVPFSLREAGLEDAFAVSAGYKYCQLGEGNAFLRTPPDCGLRPVATGWFAEFGDLGVLDRGQTVGFNRCHDRFAGATYDPTSHYRAAAVFGYFQERRLDPAFLREVSQHQIGLLRDAFDELDVDPALVRRDRSVPLQCLGGFLALHSPRAASIHLGLKKRGVFTDFRGPILRLGPAPYLSDVQLEEAVSILGEVCSAL